MEDMRALVAVVEEGSLAHAAARLHLTQPAITRRIQRLEEDLQAVLLDREQRPSKPTRDGLRAYRECVSILRASDQLREVVGGRIETELRIGISYALADRFVSPLFNRSRAISPDLMLEFTSERSGALREMLAQQRLDAAIVLLEDHQRPDPREHPIAIGTEGVRITAGRGMDVPAAGSLADYAAFPWIINPDGCGYRKTLDRRLRELGIPMTVAASVWGLPLQLQLIAEGAGIGLIPQSIALSERWRDRVAVPAVDDFAPTLDVWLVRAGHLGGLSAAVEGLAEIVAEELRASSDAPSPIPA